MKYMNFLFWLSVLSRLHLLAINKFRFLKISYRHIVHLAGPPSFGKSTTTSEVERRVNNCGPESFFT
jgi:hypothetical protein